MYWLDPGMIYTNKFYPLGKSNHLKKFSRMYNKFHKYNTGTITSWTTKSSQNYSFQVSRGNLSLHKIHNVSHRTPQLTT